MRAKFTILALLSMFTIWACTEDPIQVPNRVIVESADELGRAEVAFKSAAGDQIINLEVEGEWEVFIPKECDWLIAIPSSGSAETKEKIEVVLKAAENLEYKPRKTLVSFSCDGADQKDYVIVEQEQAFYRAVEFSHAKAMVLGGARSYAIDVAATNVSKWTASTTESWAEAKVESHEKLVLSLKENTTGKDRTAKIIVSGTEEGKEYRDELVLTQVGVDLKADLFDVIFKEDGTAEDISPEKNQIVTIPAPALTTVVDPELGYYVANFGHKFASALFTGFYIFKEEKLKPKMQDGFTLEAYFTCGAELPAGETKVFYSTADGGYALMLKNKAISFLYNGTEAGTKSWHFVNTGLLPELDSWYHVIGTWDRESGISRCYVNGELKKEENFGPVKLYHSQCTVPYFTIGGNSGGGTSFDSPVFNGTWNGKVAKARIYSGALTQEQVQAASIGLSETGIILYD